MNREALAARLLASFLDELDEQLRVLNAELLSLERGGDEAIQAERLRSVFRVAHTLKGAARAANVPLAERVCHEMETLLAAARSRTLTLDAVHFGRLFTVADALSDAGARLRARTSLDGSMLEAIALAGLASGSEAPAPAAAPVRSFTFPQPPPGEVARPEVASSGPARPDIARPDIAPSFDRSHVAPPVAASPVAASSADAPPVDTPRSGDPAAHPSPAEAPHPAGAVSARIAPAGIPERTDSALRVQGEKLDALLSRVGDLALVGGRSGAMAAELADLEVALARWSTPWRRSARQLRRRADVEGATALAHLLDEVDSQLGGLTRGLVHLASRAAAERRALAQAADDISERVRALRMRPFAEVTEALPRVVRDVAAAAGKQARFELRGGHVEADRAVLDGIREAMLHLVRNAVDHGIEPADERSRLGKPASGTVTVTAALRADRLQVTVTDDGRGVDGAAVRASRARLGRPVDGDERQVARALLEGGISTRTEASEISGRGVGVDVARSAAERLGGSLDVRWAPGEGTTFTLDCPITLARIRAVTFAVSGQRFAVPTAHVERLRRVARKELTRVHGRDALPMPDTHDGEPTDGDGVAAGSAPLPLHGLARLLGPPLVERTHDDPMPVLVMNAGSGRLAVVVDRLMSEEELVVRPLPRGHVVSAHVAGAAILPTGGVAIVLNVSSLVAAGHSAGAEAAPDLGTVASGPARRRRILVADDSITTRTLEESVLEAAGFEVVTAVDGLDAWRRLGEEGCDLVVTDVEMPRMDGFALCQAIRGSRRFAQLPVVIVSALESPEHRSRGLEAGADAYVVKSSFDQQSLLDLVRQLLA